jgi:hypothetical protein
LPGTGYREYRNTKYKLQVAGFREYKYSYLLPGSGYRGIQKYKIQVTGYRLQVSGNTNTVAGCQVPVTGKYKIQVTGCRLQVSGNTEIQIQVAGNTKNTVPGARYQYKLQVSGYGGNQYGLKCRLILFVTWNLKPVLNSFTFSHFHFSFYQLLVVI